MLLIIFLGGIMVSLVTAMVNIAYIIVVVLFFGIIWARIRPERWLIIIIFMIPLTPEVSMYEMAGYVHGEGLWDVSANLSDFIIPLLLFFFFAKKSVTARRSLVSSYYLGIPLGIYLFFAIVSLASSFLNHNVSFYFLNGLGHLIKWAGYFMLYFVVISEFQDRDSIYVPLRILIVSFAIGTIFGFTQYLQALGENPDYVRVNPLRTAGVVVGVNGYAVTLSFLIIVISDILLRGGNQKIFPRMFLQICLGLFIAALIITFSRAGWLAAFFGLSLVALKGRRNYIAVPLLAVATVVIWFAMKPVQMRVEQTVNPMNVETELPIDLGGREGIWAFTIEQIDLYNFFMGCGYFSFPFIYRYTTPHNQYLALLIEVGIFGLLAFSWIFYRIIKYMIFIYRHTDSVFLKEFSFSLIAGLSALLIACLSGEFLYSAPLMFMVLLFTGTAQVLYRHEYLDRLAQKNLAATQTAHEQGVRIPLIPSPASK
jgi:O-antigen ligase